VLAIRDDMILTQDEFDALLAALGVSDLQQALIDNEFCKDTDEEEQVAGGGGDGCATFYSALLALVELEQTITDEDGVPPDNDILGPTGGDPYFVEGDAENIGVSLGPNYQLGRRTWTDVTDD
jgi:hypothetical protein